MDTQALLILCLAAALTAGVLALCCIYSHWPAAWKTLLVVALSATAALQFDAWRDLRGWPAEAPLPPRFVFYASVISEPDAQRAGSIELWVAALDEHGVATAPRAYRRPYNRAEHGLIQQAEARMRNGQPQVGTVVESSDEQGLARDARRIASAARFVLDDLPAPALPEK